MSRKQPVSNLEQLLDRINSAAQQNNPVSLGDVMQMVGQRSFGPLVLLAGLITLAPVLGDIPGVPTIIGVLLFLIAIQLLLGRGHFWLPQWLLRRSLAQEKLREALAWLRPPARFIDRWLRPRLTKLTDAAAIYVIAGICAVIAAALPVMEVVPFTANVAGAALTAFGLALIARDGLLALIAFVLTAATAGFVAYGLL